MTDDKINNIEELLTHQERQIHDLSEMVIRQGDEIEVLKKRMGRMQDKINILEEAAPDSEGLSTIEQAARDKPPHY